MPGRRFIFPGYGWIDFDTTIPSTEQQQSPAPDGTPPITVQTALFVTHGKVTEVDTAKKACKHVRYPNDFS